MIFFPWQTICIAHPFGHVHHDHDGPSPCELRKQYKGKDAALFPPMHCHNFSADTDNYQAPDKFQIQPIYQTLAIVAVLFEFIKITSPEQPYLFPPDPNCRSATIISDNTLRGPPLV